MNGGIRKEDILPEGLDLGNHGFEDSSLDVISDLSEDQIKTTVLKFDLGGIIRGLRSGVKSAELRNQFSRVLRGVRGENLRDNVQSFAEFSDSSLFLGVQGSSVVFQVNAQSDFDGTTSGNDVSALQSSLDNTK